MNSRVGANRWEATAVVNRAGGVIGTISGPVAVLRKLLPLCLAAMVVSSTPACGRSGQASLAVDEDRSAAAAASDSGRPAGGPSLEGPSVAADAVPAYTPGAVTLTSSDAALVRAFDWAKGQALAYVFEGDPVGPWFEAALPRREAFCMRDVSHQAAGALALGLRLHLLNMLRRFAENISEAKDWCTYWEINRHNLPAPVDYRNDKEFWYNLPANFDVLDACRRVFLWTGERALVEDAVFLDYYRRTVEDYVARWDLGLDRILVRPRFMNRPSFDPEDPYQYCRGIPSYDEGDPGTMRLGIDLPALQAAAYRSYADILELRGDRKSAAIFRDKAAAVRALVAREFFDEASGRLLPRLMMDGRLVPSASVEMFALYADAVDDEDLAAATLRGLIEAAAPNIETRSHFPEVFYRYGAHGDAYRVLLELAHPSTRRREYPEVSYAVVGAVVNGLMGIAADAGDGSVATLPRLTDETDWAEIAALPILGNVIRVRHDGGGTTTFTNVSGPAITWSARFFGEGGEILVDGRPVAATRGTDRSGRPVMEARVTVEPGATAVAASAPAGQAPLPFVYREIDGRQLRLYFFRPLDRDSRDPAPAVLLFHGGGWVAGGADWTFQDAERFAALGLAAFAVDYRLSDEKITPIEALDDTRAAFRWVRRRAADFNIDPDRVAGYGVSAGGHLAAAAAIDLPGDGIDDTRSGPDLLLLWSPALDVEADGWFVRLLQGRGPAADWSPLAHAGPSTPPTCIVNGDRDTLTPLSGAERFRDRVVKSGGVCELHVYPGVGHLLTRNLSNQESDFDPHPEFRADGKARLEAFLRKRGYTADVSPGPAAVARHRGRAPGRPPGRSAR